MHPASSWRRGNVHWIEVSCRLVSSSLLTQEGYQREGGTPNSGRSHAGRCC